ncbi:tigger transposable element-derived protein 1-like [Portunus trituberculatus]|uniref:tigger transposable element-derived protein 1-like n=1 Tax=Portunus trituberculatus TaxID=210409 RepID=UPI001E1CD2C8|nr:tigger transposable element-derived protein 1-like [Portunus trituberculatus]
MKIRESAKAGAPVKGSQSSYARPVEMQRMEKMLATWIEHQNKTRVPISLALIKAKAVLIYETIEREKKPFIASNGWFNNFQKRYGFQNLKMVGEASSADAQAAVEYPAVLQKIIEDGDYSPKQVFNIDETGLYWKKLPNRTYISKEEASTPGFKASKDWLTRVKIMEEAEGAAAPAAATDTLGQPQQALTAANLSECMDLLAQSMKILEENYPNIERSTAVIRGVMEKNDML